tara:strand:+ start:893 stop:1171 length:279 start_codon:yes stop_codon:yes gene_type:complete
MSHPNSPEYFTLYGVCPFDGTTTVYGIFENMEAVTLRLKALYTSCGSEYHIECFHLTTEEVAKERYGEFQKAKKEEEARELAMEKKAEEVVA